MSNYIVDKDPRFMWLETIMENPINDDQDESARRHTWEQISEKSLELLQETPDLRVSLWHMRASLAWRGLPAFFTGFALIKQFLTTHGSKLSPHEEGEPEGSLHASSLAWIDTPEALGLLRTSYLLPSTQTCLQNIIDDPDNYMKVNSFVVNEHLNSEGLPDLLACFNQLSIDVKWVAHEVNQRSSGYFLRIDRISELISKVISNLKNRTPEVQSEKAENHKEQIQNNSMVINTSAINGRQQALQLLDQVINYFVTNEPSHPAPIMLKRVKKLIGMDFQQIIRELLPDGENAFKLINGNKSD
jgi:type VI secretion system protein ImpA